MTSRHEQPRTEGVAANPDASLLLIDGRRFSLLLVLLSMDAFLSARDFMGLPLPEVDAWLPWIRGRILGALPAPYAAPPRPSRFVPDVLTAMAAQFGEEPVVALVQWGRTTFSETADDHPALQAWSMLFERCHDDEASWQALAFPDDWADLVRRDYEQARTFEALIAHCSRQTLASLSDWDLAVCAIRGFDVAAEQYSDPFNVLTFVWHTTATWQMLELWRRIHGRLDEQACASLYARATGLLPKLGLNISRLPPPRVLHVPAFFKT